MEHLNKDIKQRVLAHIEVIYKDVPEVNDYVQLSEQILQAARLQDRISDKNDVQDLWSQQDIAVITYGDTILRDQQAPLITLKEFLDDHLQEVINNVHVLPFFPFSSDDGFAIKDYRQVNPALGDWQHINSIAFDYDLMADLVVNHCSSESMWFENFIAGDGEGHDYFFTAYPEDDIANVVRPRTSPLLNPVETKQGIKHVWCTFSHDQVDLYF